MQARVGGKSATMALDRLEARGILSDIAIRLFAGTAAATSDPHGSATESSDPGDTH